MHSVRSWAGVPLSGSLHNSLPFLKAHGGRSSIRGLSCLVKLSTVLFMYSSAYLGPSLSRRNESGLLCISIFTLRMVVSLMEFSLVGWTFNPFLVKVIQ